MLQNIHVINSDILGIVYSLDAHKHFLIRHNSTAERGTLINTALQFIRGITNRSVRCFVSHLQNNIVFTLAINVTNTPALLVGAQTFEDSQRELIWITRKTFQGDTSIFSKLFVCSTSNANETITCLQSLEEYLTKEQSEALHGFFDSLENSEICYKLYNITYIDSVEELQNRLDNLSMISHTGQLFKVIDNIEIQNNNIYKINGLQLNNANDQNFIDGICLGENSSKKEYFWLCRGLYGDPIIGYTIGMNKTLQIMHLNIHDSLQPAQQKILNGILSFI